MNMQVIDVMTSNPACCTPGAPLEDVAKMMVDNDCGCIPVVQSEMSRVPVGVVTDRDICTRLVAQGRNPLELTASDAMSANPVTVTPETSLEDCCGVMEEHRIRRVLVVDSEGGCCGVVAQADVAVKASEKKTGEVVQEISKTAAAVSGF